MVDVLDLLHVDDHHHVDVDRILVLLHVLLVVEIDHRLVEISEIVHVHHHVEINDNILHHPVEIHGHLHNGMVCNNDHPNEIMLLLLVVIHVKHLGNNDDNRHHVPLLAILKIHEILVRNLLG